jgi:hypothetical protein
MMVMVANRRYANYADSRQASQLNGTGNGVDGTGELNENTVSPSP